MCGGPNAYNVYRTRLDWAVDDELKDPNTSAVTRPWKCSHSVTQQVEITAGWVMSEALYVVFWEVKRLVISLLRWIWDGINEVMGL
ncbi:hypothetical protein NCS52_00439700 [Fusarium sp. LHS14.1]|nr:hypothetical protein NCS52_00439700 [Fusarium sp. LHS14.1]